MKDVKQGNSFFEKKLYREPNTASRHTEQEIHLAFMPVQVVTVFPLTGVSRLWWHVPSTSALEAEASEFKASRGYI